MSRNWESSTESSRSLPEEERGPDGFELGWTSGRARDFARKLPESIAIRSTSFTRSSTSLSGKFLSKLPGKEPKSESEAGNQKSQNPCGSRGFILGLLRFSRIGALPKLDVAGSTWPRQRTCVWRITDFPRISNSPHAGWPIRLPIARVEQAVDARQ